MSDTEVKARLSLEDDVSDELDDVEDKLGDVEKAEKDAEGGFQKWAATASHVAQSLGINLSDVVGKVKELGASYINAGSQAEAGDQAVAALIKTAQGAKTDDAIEKAERLGDAIDEIAINAGISGDAVGGAFQSILEKTGASEAGINRAVNELDKMSVVAATLDKDVGGVANEFAFMQEGVLKTKGQLFQLLQSTGIFGNDAKKAGEAWGKLSEEKRAELLSFGLDRLAGTMRDMPPTFKQTEASLENMWRISKERIGQPLIEELAPALDEVSKQLVDLGPDIDAFARAMAKDVGSAVREGGRMLREAVGWLKEHKDEIAQGFREGAEKVKAVIDFVLAHKEEIALAFGAKTAMPILKPAAGVVGDVAKAGFSGAGGGVLGVGGAGVAGAAVSLAAFSAAIIAVGLAADQAQKLLHELDDAEDTRLGGMKRLAELADKGDVEKVVNTVNTMKQIDEGMGRLSPQMKEFYDRTVRIAEASKRMADEDEARLLKQINMGKRGAADVDAQSGAKYSADTQGQLDQQARNQVAILVNAYNQAVDGGNKQMAALAAQALAGSSVVGAAFLESNEAIKGGFEGMADVLAASGGQFKDFVDKLKGKGAVAAPKAPTINMSGGQTFNVKQDFRDQNPDKIALFLRRDVGRMAARKLQSSFAGPFGG